ncbi:D-isomer specific 2-hydroxyacid dehydrogenase [Chlamydoabsidia padenii]|nr:D-isomer specific 2-hydroxyacid dehydrogenase [Chlamydoabsidia padenii]
MSPTCLIVGCVTFATDRLVELQKEYSIEYYTSRNRQEFFADCQGKYKDITLIYRSPESQATVGPFDEELVNQLPPNLKWIVYCGAGYDSIDVGACAARKIMVSHTPSAVDNATADIAATLILNCCRNAYQAEHNLRQGRFRHGVSMGIDPEGKILGILGLGGIGKTIAKRMSGFEMNMIYHNRTRLSTEVEKQLNVTYVDFETLLKTSDIISVSVPLNKATTHLLSFREFAMMKKGVVVVNTARGKVINETALVQALESGKVLSAGLDVYEEEPKVHPGLLTHPRSVLLPHIGTFTNESQKKMEDLVLDNLVSALTKNTLITPVPEHRSFFQ